MQHDSDEITTITSLRAGPWKPYAFSLSFLWENRVRTIGGCTHLPFQPTELLLCLQREAKLITGVRERAGGWQGLELSGTDSSPTPQAN